MPCIKFLLILMKLSILPFIFLFFVIACCVLWPFCYWIICLLLTVLCGWFLYSASYFLCQSETVILRKQQEMEMGMRINSVTLCSGNFSFTNKSSQVGAQKNHSTNWSWELKCFMNLVYLIYEKIKQEWRRRYIR